MAASLLEGVLQMGAGAAAAAAAAEATPPVQYVRKTRGWEVFRCPCGGSVQLSPRFSGTRMRCPKCSRAIEVVTPDA